jgi:hypothetical protein
MSARKLGRLVGLVFVLAALFGGVASHVAKHEAGGLPAISAVKMVTLELVWA